MYCSFKKNIEKKKEKIIKLNPAGFAGL